MTLKRRIRKVGSSLVITIPAQIADVYGYKEGVSLEIEVLPDKIVYRKAKK